MLCFVAKLFVCLFSEWRWISCIKLFCFISLWGWCQDWYKCTGRGALCCEWFSSNKFLSRIWAKFWYQRFVLSAELLFDWINYLMRVLPGYLFNCRSFCSGFASFWVIAWWILIWILSVIATSGVLIGFPVIILIRTVVAMGWVESWAAIVAVLSVLVIFSLLFGIIGCILDENRAEHGNGGADFSTLPLFLRFSWCCLLMLLSNSNFTISLVLLLLLRQLSLFMHLLQCSLS